MAVQKRRKRDKEIIKAGE